LVGEFAAEEATPVGLVVDREHPRLEDGEVHYPEQMDSLFDQMREMGIHGLCLPRELGGVNAPFMLFLFNTELLARADVSIAAHHGFHGGMAMASLFYSVVEGTTEFELDPPRITKTRFQEAIDDIVSGEEWGSMDITEPSAGSDMAAMRTRGEQDEDGNWFVTGQKIFITSGHGKWHYVIARTETVDEEDAFAGLKGLSLFLVPAWSEDEDGNRVRTVTVDTLEHKLGHNGSATVAISFENSPAELVGNRGEGFKQMLLLMNNARVGVGFECLGLCESALRMARAYAAERPSMGKTIDKHEMIADYLDEMDIDIRAIRALSVTAGYCEEMAQKLRIKLTFMPPEDEAECEALRKQIKKLQMKTRHLTPLLKYLAAEKCVQMSQRCIQIHGGSGYITEYGAEKLLRDAMVMPIYEGTSQIQALMAMKDNLMTAVNKPQRFVRKAAQTRWKSLSARDPLERRVARIESTGYQAIQFLISRLTAEKFKELRGRSPRDWTKVLTGWDPKRDFALAMLHAERLTNILVDAAVCNTLLDQVRSHPERTYILEAYLERAEPRCRFYYDEITTTGLRMLRSLDDQDEVVEEELTQQAAK
jgi:hypothetical protein